MQPEFQIKLCTHCNFMCAVCAQNGNCTLEAICASRNDGMHFNSMHIIRRLHNLTTGKRTTWK